MSIAAKAQPTGGSVVAGSAQISAAGASTVINQNTSKAIINWQSFSVGQGGSVQFNQPSASAITLNRVTGTSTSVIDGAIRANGQVWLLNPNGLLFGNGASINVGGLLATTSDIADQDFLGGRYNFSSTGGKGGITNSGSIIASNGGSVVLSAPNVTNKGLIAATAGHVVLGGTDTFTVDFAGDHLLSYAISPNSTGGKVTNAGKIAAAGGTILMTARAAAGVQDAVINNSGMVEATSVRQENGEIILEADNGTVSDSGTLDASGKASGQTGGTVKVLGQQVAVADGARIDVSGDAGGGTALIGGNLHGAGPEPNAQNTTVGKVSINASAITSGNGGTVAVYSTGTTKVAATITAQGGITSGNGGMVETSGHLLGVDNAAFVSTLAPHGKSGTWLLDPDFINITSAGSEGVSQTFSTTGTASISPGTIATALSGGNVDLQANFDITVNNAVSASSTNNTLYLEAGRSIILNAGLQNTGGEIALFAGDTNAPGGVQPGATISGSGVISAGVIQLSLGATGSIGTSVQPIMISDANSGQLAFSAETLGADAYVQTASGIAATELLVYNTGTVAALGIGNHEGINLTSAFAGTLTGSTTVGSFNLTTSVPLDQAWSATAQNVTINATGTASISFNDIGEPPVGDPGNQIAGAVNFTTANGNVSYGNSISTGTTLTGTDSIAGSYTIVSGQFGPPFASTPTTTYYPLSIGSTINATGTVSITATDIQQTGGSGIVASGAVLIANSGSVGSSTTPISLSNGGSPITASASSTTTGIFLSATGDLQVGGQVDAHYGIDAGAGDVNLSASGNISQTVSSFGINANNLTATSTGGSVTLTDAGSCCTDNGNVIAGTARFSTALDASFTNADSQTVTTTIGASTVGGSLTVDATETSIALTDGSGSISVTGAASFTSGVGAISQMIPLSASGLSASGTNITLTNAGNLISGTVSLMTPGSDGGNGASVSTLDDISLGNVSTFGGLSVISSGVLTLTGNIGAGGNSGSAVTLGGSVINQTGGHLSIATGMDSFTASASASGPQTTLSLTSASNAIQVPITLHGDTIAFTNSSDTTLEQVNRDNSSAATSVSILVSSESSTPQLSVDSAINATGTVSLHAGGSILATNEGSSINAGTLILQSDSGVIGSSTNPRLRIIASNLTAQTGGGNVYLDIENASDNGLSIGSTANPNVGISAGTGNVTLYLFDTPVVQAISAPIIANSLDLEVHCSNFCNGGVDVSLPASGNAVSNLTLNQFFDAGSPVFNFDFNNSLPIVFGDPSVGTTIPGNLTLTTTAESGAPIVITGPVTSSAPLGVISLSADGDIGAAQVTDANIAGSLLANEVDLKSNAGQIGGQTGTVPPYGGLMAAWQPLNVISNVVTAGTNGRNITLNLGSFIGEGSTVTIGSNTAGIDALGTASTPGDVTLVVNHDVAVGQASTPIVARNLALSSESGGNGLSLTATNLVSGTVNLSTVSGSIAFTNGTDTTLGSTTAAGSITVNSAGGITVPGGNTITAGTNSSLIGNVTFTAGGVMTIGGAINTSNAIVYLDTGSSIFVNAPISNPANGSFPGTIVLTANDPGLSGNSDSNGIFNGDGVTLTAATISLDAGGGANGLSGSIGMAASNPLMLTSDTGAVSLGVRSFNGNAYLLSAVPVSIDDESSDVPNGARGINTAGSNGFYGEVFLTAAGPITQTYGIQSGILTLTSTGATGAIALTDTGVSGDPGNSVFGQVHLYSSGSAAYSSNMGANLGASTVAGNLVVTSSNGDLDVQDPNGGPVQVTGVTILTAGSGNGIFIQTPVISGSSVTLSADQNISQSVGTSDSHIQTGGSLIAQSSSGSISLADLGCGGAQSCGGDVGNQVSGIAQFSAAGNVVFGASSSLSLYNVTATNGGKIKIVSGGNLTLVSSAVLTSTFAPGYSIDLSAAGNFINDTGPNALSMPSGASFAIFSAAPAGDVFGGLNSGNTAIWGTTFSLGNNNQATVTGDRYVFALQPTLTVSTGSASKVYGVNDGASLPGFTVSGFQPGVSGAYLADTLSSVFGTTPQAASAGSAATANVGTYAVTLGVSPIDGYAISAQNGTLTVTPATLTYLANAASRSAGDPNPAFSGTVTGFVNTDTQASSTIGTLSFTSTATPTSPAGSYTINGSGLLATNYVFVQAAANASALTITPSTQPQITGATPVLTGFTAAIQPPLLNPANTPLGAPPLNLITLPVVPPPPPPPPAQPPVQSPLADNNSEQPTSSDQTTDQVAGSLDGNNAPPPGPGPRGGGGTVIPRMLVNARPPAPPPTDTSALSSFGNSSLWQ